MVDQLIKFLGSLQSYFNDFVGLIAPALIFCSLLAPALGIEMTMIAQFGQSFGQFHWIAALAALFAIGHVLAALRQAAEQVWETLTGRVERWKSLRERRYAFEERLSPDVLVFRELVARTLSVKLDRLSRAQLRAVAMTISADGEELGRRFRFIAMFCRATAAAVVVLGLANLYAAFAGTRSAGEALAVLLLAVATAYVLKLPVDANTAKAEAVPFGAAIGDICARELGITTTSTPVRSEKELRFEAGKPPRAPEEFPG